MRRNTADVYFAGLQVDRAAGDRAMRRLARKRRRSHEKLALLELLRGELWTEFISQSFQPLLGMGALGRGAVLTWTRRVWILALGSGRLSSAFLAVEPHKSGQPHVHALWRCTPPLSSAERAVLKERLGRNVGWVRIRPFIHSIGGERYCVKRAALYASKGARDRNRWRYWR